MTAPQVSQNGWPASLDPHEIGLRWYSVPGTNVTFRLAPAAAPLLLAFASFWHATVEPITDPGCWSYNYRPIRGTEGKYPGWETDPTVVIDPEDLTNHASGSAIDINAPLHPFGQRGTVPDELRAAIAAKAAELGLVWGAGFPTPDEMHAELAISPDEAVALAASLGLTEGGPVEAFDAYARYQELTDARAVRGSKGFGYIKATDGAPFTAVWLAEWVAAFADAGEPIGPYHFALPAKGNAAEQADYFADVIGQYEWQLVPCLDIESAGPDLPGFVRAFRDRMRARGHHRLLVYSYTQMFRDQLDVDSWCDVDVFLWIADPNAAPGQPRWTHPQARLHQYGEGPVPGISGSTDLDVSIGPVEDLFLQEDDMTLDDVIGQRRDGTDITVRQVLIDVHWKETTNLGLGDRPGADSDDQFGHTLSIRAELRQLAARVDALTEAVAALPHTPPAKGAA